MRVPRRGAEQAAARGRGRRARETEAMELVADGAMREDGMRMGAESRGPWG